MGKLCNMRAERACCRSATIALTCHVRARVYIQIRVFNAKDDKEKQKAKGKCDAIYKKNPCLKARDGCESCINTKVGRKTCTFDGNTKTCVAKKPNKNTLFHLSKLFKGEKPAKPGSDAHRQNVKLICTCADYWHESTVVETCHNRNIAQHTKLLISHAKRLREAQSEIKRNKRLSQGMSMRNYITGDKLDCKQSGGTVSASGTSGDVIFCSLCDRPGKKFAVKIYREPKLIHQLPKEIAFYTEHACKHYVHYEGFVHYEYAVLGHKPKVHGLVMEACDASLDVISWGKNLLTVQDKLQILIDVADGLIHMHSKGIVWADLKPENVMIGCGRNKGKYRAKLADFEMVVDGRRHKRKGDVPKCAAVEKPETLHWFITDNFRGSPRFA